MYENGGFTLENLGGDKGDWSWVRCTVHAAEWLLSCFPFLLSPGALPDINLSTFYLHASIFFNYKKNSSKNIIYSFYMPQMFFCMNAMWPKSLHVWWDFFPKPCFSNILKKEVINRAWWISKKLSFLMSISSFPFCMTFVYHFKEYSSLPPIKHFRIISDVFF